MPSKRSYWGWGYADFPFPKQTLQKYKAMFRNLFQIKKFEEHMPIPVENLKLRSPRFVLPPMLEPLCSSSNFDRASHTYGKSFRDVWRGFHGIFPNPPDYVAFPKTEQDIMDLMTFATNNQISLIPFGGGSSVCGGTEPTENPLYKGVISVDMQYFNQVLEIDKVSRSAHIQGGMFGPALEAALKPHGLTLRHFPKALNFRLWADGLPLVQVDISPRSTPILTSSFRE